MTGLPPALPPGLHGFAKTSPPIAVQTAMREGIEGLMKMLRGRASRARAMDHRLE